MDRYHTIAYRKSVRTICKLGTDNDWRYVRRQEAELLLPRDSGESADIAAALQDTLILWRFRWPDEDDQLGKTKKISERDMRRVAKVILPNEFLARVPHSRMSIPVRLTPFAAPYFELRIPCPLSSKFDLDISGNTPTIINVVGEREYATVFECAWCHRRITAQPDAMEQIEISCRSVKIARRFRSDERPESLRAAMSPLDDDKVYCL
jgi:hypothetical protein